MKNQKILAQNTTIYNQPKMLRGYILCAVIAALLTIAATLYKYTGGNITYYNADATWHTLYTVTAYDQTPTRQHRFLPIVTLGAPTDKYIPWGSCVADAGGNFYYTSFSPAGFFLPWLFFKIFNLPANELSLYVFNSFLFTLSAVLWVIFLKWVFKKNLIAILGAAIYIFTPELLHGMGIVYWHQSVMQVTLIIQLMAYYRWRVKQEGNVQKFIFLIITFFNPYIEWTGYVANFGYIIAELLKIKKGSAKTILINITLIAGLTAAAFFVFCAHYLLRVNPGDYIAALKSRSLSRGVASGTKFKDLFGSYIESFKYMWLVFLLLIALNIYKYKKIEFRHALILLLLVFPLIENLLMKQHAYMYSFDRMKAVLPLSFMCCDLIEQFIGGVTRRFWAPALACAVAACGFMNLWSYKNDGAYIWDAPYRKTNSVLAEYITNNYPDSVMGIGSVSVRGYMNLLFGKGIHDFNDDVQILSQSAVQNNLPYVVILKGDTKFNDRYAWGIHNLTGATVYNVANGTAVEITPNSDGTVTVRELG